MKYRNKTIRVPEKSSGSLFVLTIQIMFGIVGLGTLISGIIGALDEEAILICAAMLFEISFIGLLFDVKLIQKANEMKAVGYPAGKKWYIIGVVSACLFPLFIPNIFTMIWYYKTNVARQYAIAHNAAVENGLFLEIERREASTQQRFDDSIAETVIRESTKYQPQGKQISRPDALKESHEIPASAASSTKSPSGSPVNKPAEAPSKTPQEESGIPKGTTGGKLNWK